MNSGIAWLLEWFNAVHVIEEHIKRFFSPIWTIVSHLIFPVRCLSTAMLAQLLGGVVLQVNGFAEFQFVKIPYFLICNVTAIAILFMYVMLFPFISGLFILLLISNDGDKPVWLWWTLSLELRWFANLYCCSITDVSWYGNLANVMSFSCFQISFKGPIDSNNIAGLDPNS